MAETQGSFYKIYVNYFVQNDSWEKINEPNFFIVPIDYSNLNDVKVKDIYDNFPLKGAMNYYLRFFLEDKEKNM
jgi:hypothetical protein